MRKLICLGFCVISFLNVFAQYENNDLDRKLNNLIKEKNFYNSTDTINIYFIEFALNKKLHLHNLIIHYLSNDTLKSNIDTSFLKAINSKDISEISSIPYNRLYSQVFLIPFVFRRKVDFVANLFAENHFSAKTFNSMFTLLSRIMNKYKKCYYILNPLIVFETKPTD